MRHGFDADHLATIDGLTRANLHHRPALARYCGTLFSLGHGAVVMLIALSVSLLAGRWHVPEWFGPVKKRAMGLPWGLAETTPVVNTPVRMSPSGRVTSNTFMPVSSP